MFFRLIFSNLNILSIWSFQISVPFLLNRLNRKVSLEILSKWKILFNLKNQYYWDRELFSYDSHSWQVSTHLLYINDMHRMGCRQGYVLCSVIKIGDTAHLIEWSCCCDHPSHLIYLSRLLIGQYDEWPNNYWWQGFRWFWIYCLYISWDIYLPLFEGDFFSLIYRRTKFKTGALYYILKISHPPNIPHQL